MKRKKNPRTKSAVVSSRPSGSPASRPRDDTDKGKGSNIASGPGPRQLAIVAACLVLVTVAVYANSLQNGFVFDDHAHVLENPYLRSIWNLFHLIRDYRPLRDISYAVDFSLWGESTLGFHLTNIIIHLANTVLVFLLVYRIVHDLPAAAIAALIFAVHPMQTDSVAYVSGRRDVLFAFFYLGAFHCYLSHYRKRSAKTAIAVFLLWFLSLASKEMAASLPVLIFAWAFIEMWPSQAGSFARRVWTTTRVAALKDKWVYSVAVLGAAAYGYYQVVVRGASERVGPNGIKFWGGSFFANMLLSFRVHGWLLKQLVYPTPIAQYLGAFDTRASLADWRLIVSVLAVLGLLAAAGGLLTRMPELSFAIVSYFILLLPVSQIVPHHELVADHYLYLPLASFGLLIGAAGCRLWKWRPGCRRPFYVAAAGALAIFAVITIRGNAFWKDDYALWQRNYSQVPNSPRAAYGLATQYVSLNPQRAVELLHKCIDLDPSYGAAYIDLATLAKSRAEFRTVEGLISSASAIPPAEVSGRWFRSPAVFKAQLMIAQGICKGGEGDRQGAELAFESSIASDPINPQPYEMLSALYEKDPAKQIGLLKRAVQAMPTDAVTLDKLGYALIKQASYDDAIPYLMRAIAINPEDVFADFQLAEIYRSRLDCPRARSYLTRAQAAATSPDDVKQVSSAFKVLNKECGSQ